MIRLEWRNVLCAQICAMKPDFYIATKRSSHFSDIDDCVSNPCKFNGTCIDEITDYTCDCVDGYRGKSCEESKYNKEAFITKSIK